MKKILYVLTCLLVTTLSCPAALSFEKNVSNLPNQPLMVKVSNQDITRSGNLYKVQYQNPEYLKSKLVPFLFKGEFISIYEKNLLIFASKQRYSAISDLALKFDTPPAALVIDIVKGKNAPQSRYTVDAKTGEKTFLKEGEWNEMEVSSGSDLEISTQSIYPGLLKNNNADAPNTTDMPLDLDNTKVEYLIKIIPTLHTNEVSIRAYDMTKTTNVLKDSTIEQTSLSFNQFKLPLGEWVKLSEYFIRTREAPITQSESPVSTQREEVQRLWIRVRLKDEIAKPIMRENDGR